MVRSIFLAAAIFPLCGFADTCPIESDYLDEKQQHRATLRHIESGGIGYEDGYTTLEAFVCTDPSQWRVTPFLDLRGHVFDNGRWAANVGAGLRSLWKNRVYGINTYYDYRNTSRLNANQVGVGLETLGELFDFRINGYLPFGTKTSHPFSSTFGTFSGNYMLVSQKYQSAMKGSDAEFGFHFGSSESFDFYAAAGPYYFIGQKAPTTWGGKARIAGTFRKMLTLEISNSCDRTFHNKFQGQISLSFPFGPKSNVTKQECGCTIPYPLTDRMLQTVNRQEIIVVDNARRNSVAIDPATGLPYFFVFVDNTSSSDGTYESPYHNFAQAQSSSSPNNIIYVFPGNGTTTGMDSGISLQANQKLWGSGVSHLIQTTAGTISIPAQTLTSPVITNTDIDTLGNAVTLATNNSISGFTFASVSNDAIHGEDAHDAQSLEVSSCTFENTATYTINASFFSDALISITNNQFLTNTNGIVLHLNGTSNLVCSNNTFKDQGQGQVGPASSIPLEVLGTSNSFTALIQDNLFNNNKAGSIRFNLTTVVNADISVLNNTITNNGTGSQSSLGSSVVILPTGTTDHCSIRLENNTFSGNESNSLYFHTSGAFTVLDTTASTNRMSNNGGGGVVLATPVTDTLTFVATDNRITDAGNDGIAVIASALIPGSPTLNGNITIHNNIIKNITGQQNGISVNQAFSSLDLTILNNKIKNCEGTGIISYASSSDSPTGINSLTLNISDNTITNCQNLSTNAASGLDIEQYTNLAASIRNNKLSDNAGAAFVIGSTLSAPSVCLTLTGNENSSDYFLTNPFDGLFNLSPCSVDSLNVGTISRLGLISNVQSCSDPTPCPPP